MIIVLNYNPYTHSTFNIRVLVITILLYYNTLCTTKCIAFDTTSCTCTTYLTRTLLITAYHIYPRPIMTSISTQVKQIYVVY